MIVEFLQDLSFKGVKLGLNGEKLRIGGSQSVLTSDVIAQLQQHKTEILQVLQDTPDILNVYPLSYGQQAMWFLWQLAPENGFYNVAFTCRICSYVNVTTLQKTFQTLIERHPQLRSSFPKQGNKPVQKINQTELTGFQQINASTWSDQELHQQVFQESQQPFDLENGSVMRVSLFTRSEQEHILLLTVHHIAIDAWCLPLLMEEMIMTYPALESGVEPPLTPLKNSYIDYVRWQRELLTSTQGEKLWNYWQKKLAGDLPVLNLPTDRPRPSIQTYNGASHRFTLSPKLTEQIKQLAQKEGATQSMVLLAAFKILLYRYTGQEDILVGVPSSGRTKSEFMPLVGYFVDPVVMRVNFSESPSFQEFLSQIRQTVSEALAHQDFPFALLVERLQSKRDPSRSPIFQALFNFVLQNLRQFPYSQQLLLGGEVDREGFKLKPYEMSQMEGQFDLDLMMAEGSSDLVGFFRYNTDLFDEQTIAQMASHFQNILAAIISNPQQKVSQLPLFNEAEKQQILMVCQDPVIKSQNNRLIYPEWAENSPIYVLDSHRELLPFGVEGEIYIGDTHQQHEQSTTEVIEHPLLGRLLRTKTWGRLRRDGSLEVLGLIQRQAWIGGHRINFQTVEQELLSIFGIEDCYVMAREGKLVAYVVSSKSLANESLNAHLQAKLPDYMLPIAYVQVSNLPLTATGQIDEQVLTSLEVIDTKLLEKWQQQLNSHPEIDQAVVIASSRHTSSPPPLHLAKLLPPGINNTAISLTVAETASVVGLVSTETPQFTTPAISDGGLLNIPEDAPKTLTAALIQTASRSKNQGITYISAKGEKEFQTYTSLLDEAKRILNGLQNQGLQPGQRVILQIASLRDYFPTLWACILGGIQPVTVAVAPTYTEKNAVINKLYNTWELLEHPCILASDALVKALENLRSLLPLSELKVCSVGELRKYSAIAEIYPCRPDEVAFLQLTSGSTGVPKCIQETHQGIIAHIHAAQQFNGYATEDIGLNWLPVDHVVPILTCHFKDTYLGCQQIEVETAVILANPLKWLDLMEEYRVSHSWSPNFGFKLISEVLTKTPGKNWDLSSVKFLMNAGEQVTPRVIREFLNSVAHFGISSQVMQPAFGMAEVCTCMTYQNQFNEQTDIYRIKKSSVGGQLEQTTDSSIDVIEFTDLGRPVPGVQIRITDDKNSLLPEGVIGRFQIKGKVVTPGYLNNPQANAEAFVGDGWFNSGDLGFILNGHLVLTGREKEVIIINGANYYCYEIEDIVNSIAGVAPTYAGACAFSNQQTGTEGLAIFFSPEQTDSQLNLEVIQAIRREVTSQLGIAPYYVIPVERQEFPKTTSGKIQRSQLRKKLESGDFSSLIQEIDIKLGKNTIPDWFYQKVWCQKQARINPISTVRQTVIVFLDDLGLGQSLCQRLEAQNYPCIKVEVGNHFAQISSEHYVVNPANEEDYAQLITSLITNNYAIGHIFHLWNYEIYNDGISNLENLDVSQQKGLYSLLFLVKAIDKLHETKERIQLLFVDTCSQVILPTDAIAYQKATVFGFLKTIPQEIPWLDCRHIDLPIAAVEINRTYLLAEFSVLTPELEVAYRDGQRLVPRLQKTDFAQQEQQQLPFKTGGVYLITGGLGGIGVKIARYLLEHYQARLLLIGRTLLPDESTWENYQEGEDKLIAKIQAYQQLRQLPGAVLYQSVDICNLDDMKQTLDLVSSQWHTQIDGVIHLAGGLPEHLIASETKESLVAGLQQKVMGTWVLHHLLQNQNPGFFIHFSSVNSFFGGTGVSAYAAANSFQEAFSTYQRKHSSWQSYCLSWSMWDETGMSRGYPMKDLSQAKGYCAISPSQGMDSLLVALAHRSHHLFIGLDASKLHIQQFTLDCQSLQQLTALFTAQTSELSIAQLQLYGVSDRFGTPTHCNFVQLDEMPLTDAGEVDIKQLTHTYTGLKVTEQTEPRNQVESQLAEIFQKVLGLEKIGIHDNFFTLGGHSVLAAQIVSQIQETFGCDLPLWVLFQSSTIAELAQIIEKSHQSSPEEANANRHIEEALTNYPCIVPIKPGGKKRPFFLIHPMASFVFPYYPVAYQLGADQPVYGIQSPGLTGYKEPLKRVEEMAAYYIEAIRAVQPEGPYSLAGWSLGAYIAYEMALRLQQANQEVDLLVLFDSPPSLKTGYKARDFGRIAGLIVSFQDNLPWLYDYLALIRVAEPLSSQPSPGDGQTKGLIKKMLSFFGYSSVNKNHQDMTIGEKLGVTLRLCQMVMSNIQALLRYKASSYDGKVILLKTSDSGLDQDETWGWREFAKGGVDVHTVPGNHLTLVRHPNASAIAQILRRYLDCIPDTTSDKN
ncbi:SDR family NAD(P)-dependent oxidoreductase [Sphaerospermopsis aphanizomenoides BCCUSP55]|uniref:SDR family NAD(P)-dependent oxidoreductase n=1 Tax=Sphaerospermopsis aphanizomenoides TaxID=459663 RepID=UPI000A6CF905|nr:SDR family NAD(P)-dependent oxidoreductase [Sphaerospermopsis aphanizomenoides]MBK1987687.1 SDR family NAD(P)-dependent oxidoreductase [Sphaerospermopsis aphanizomenoides BCCUSP55]